MSVENLPDINPEKYKSTIERHFFEQNWKDFQRELGNYIGAICREYFPSQRQRSENYRDIESAARTRVICALFGDRPYDPQRGNFITFLYSLIKNALILMFYHTNADRRKLVASEEDEIGESSEYSHQRAQIEFIMDKFEIQEIDRPEIVGFFLEKKPAFRRRHILRGIAWALVVNNFDEVRG